MKMKFDLFDMAWAVMLAAALTWPQSSAADALASGKHALVLQVGSDWCVSGEDVRKVFESDEFRRTLGSKFTFAVYDDMDTPDATISAANETLKGCVVRTKRFPAITCISPSSHFFAQFENLPRNITAAKLAADILDAAKKAQDAEKLFRKGTSLRDHRPSEAADAYGTAFDILENQCGEFNAAALREGPLAYAKEWNALRELDANDRYGWVRHFTMGAGVEIVTAANKFREDGDFAGGKAYIDSLRKIPMSHFSTNQQQCIDMAEYALWRKDASRSASNIALLEHAFSLGRDTLWGQSAMGYLILAGRNIERKPIERVALLPRPASKSGGQSPRFPLSKVRQRLALLTPKSVPTEAQKHDIAIAAVLRAIGESGWKALNARPGAKAFIITFFKDRAWMEDFVWSGPCRGEQAILALESLVFQDGGRWIKGEGEGRRFATAVALEYHDRDEAWLADFLDAYRATAEAGRLHKRALSQPVWQWRFAVHQGQPTASVDDAPRQQRFLSWYVNMPQRDYGSACWMVPYRTFNCFGDSVQGPLYYESWEAAGEWPKRKYSPIVGGVCGELSKFGSACGNVHGLPSCTAGQPAHCAYTRRLADGKWEVDYSVTYPTRMHVSFWKNPLWTYVQALEGTFEGDREKRLDADRMIELARLAEDRGAKAKEVEAYLRQACRSWRSHYNAWHEYGEWVGRSGASLDTMRIWVRGCARGMRTSRQPLWDFFTPYFARVAREKGAQALADAIVEFAPLMRQDETKLQEEADFKDTLAEWAAPIAGNVRLSAQVLKAMLDVQYGTRDFFSQTLGWGGDVLMSAEDGMKAFFNVIDETVAAKSAKGDKAKFDFRPLLLGASTSGNMTAFRQLAQLQNRIEQATRSGKQYPVSDFGGTLLSSDGMLRTSSTSRWDVPARYTRCIDATPKDGNGFHTDKEKAPWAMVVLPGPANVCGVVVENNALGSYSARQIPLEVHVSEDGETWRSVFRDDQLRETYKVDLRKTPYRACQVRVRRQPGAKEEVFHLGKILVYGKKLY